MTDYVSRRIHLFSLILAALLLAGCRSADHTGVRWESQAFKDRLTKIRDHGLDPGSQRLTAEVQIDDGSMQALVDLALKNNPEIKAGRLRVERLNERPAQVAELDDPVAALTVGELAQTAAGQVDYIVSLTQALPYPGTLDARKAVAEQEVLTASAELLDVMERVAVEVRRVY
ncbi:MAG: TolC family protein, partial [Phycisphaeraceae bacterium]